MSNRPNRNYGNYNNKRPYKKGSYRRGDKRRSRKEFYLPQGTVVYILDIINQGGPGTKIQTVETPNFNLFEMDYDQSKPIKLQEKVVIKRDPSCKVGKVRKRLNYHGLTQVSKELLQSTIEMHIEENQELYIKFINNAGPITTKRHTLNLFPGVGQKLMWEIIQAREEKKFDSFEDFQKRIKSIKSLKTLISKRIINEIVDDEEKHLIFVKRRQKQQSQRRSYKKSSGYKRQSYKKDYRRTY